LVQGVFTGTVVAAQAMVAAYTPERRSGVALGSLSAAVYMGSMAGTFVGGMFAEYFGYRYAFYASGFLLIVAGLLVFFGAKEEFTRPTSVQPKTEGQPTRTFSDFRHVWPILVLLAAMGFGRQFDTSFFPLLIQHILGTIQGAAFWTGAISAVAAAAGFLAGIVFGRLADHFSPSKIAKIAAFFAGLFLIFHWRAQGFVILSIARFGMTFCAGGLDPLFQIWLAKETPPEKRGTIFGWSATARSMGWFLAPIMSGMVASGLGIRSIYIVEALLFVGFLPLISWVAKTLSRDSPQ
jgi:DHA1 family multidrug resistance protein-like MFS transporter